jgi:hypothetical protein
MSQVPKLKTEKFGWANRRWGQSDHLVLCGFNLHSQKHFAFVSRHVRDLLKKETIPFFGRHSPVTRAGVVLGTLPIATRSKFQIEYVGSVMVSKTAVSHRHFVFATIEYVANAESSRFGYNEFMEDTITKCFGQFEAPIVSDIITRRLPLLVAVA